jgi:ribose 5-phosphate isomerase B
LLDGTPGHLNEDRLEGVALRIAIGSDHRGFALKETIVSLLEELGHEHVDLGCHDQNPVDYPDVAVEVAQAVVNGQADCGVLICGTGVGMGITANKVPGVRAAICSDPTTAKLARQHNNANMLCMGGGVIGEWQAKEIIQAYLSADFEGGRHSRRIDKIHSVEGRFRVQRTPSNE